MSAVKSCERCGRPFRQTMTGTLYCSQACAAGLRPRACRCENPIPLVDEDGATRCHLCGKDLSQRPPTGAAPRRPSPTPGRDFWKKAA